MFAVLRPYAHRVFMVEQPFPVMMPRVRFPFTTPFSFISLSVLFAVFVSYRAECRGVVQTASGPERDAWCALRGEYAAAGMPVFADESCCDADDIPLLLVRFRFLLGRVLVRWKSAATLLVVSVRYRSCRLLTMLPVAVCARCQH
jgi:hypothetical protein